MTAQESALKKRMQDIKGQLCNQKYLTKEEVVTLPAELERISKIHCALKAHCDQFDELDDIITAKPLATEQA